MLRHCLPASIRQTLNQLPQSLDDTYLRTLRQIPQANQALAHRMLQCLVVAFRPLYVEELAELLAFEFNGTARGIPQYHPALRLDDQTEAVLSTCSSLVTIIDEPQNPIFVWLEPPRRIVQFSHFSVKEFLVSIRLASSLGDISQYHIRLASAHTVLTQACLGLLLHSDDHLTDESTKISSLAEYAARHWVEHAHFEDIASRVRDGIETLFDPDKPHFSAWVNIHDIANDSRSIFEQVFEHSSEIENPLYYAVLCRFNDLIEHLAIKYPHYINAVYGQFQFPLLAAFKVGNMKAAEFLLEHGVDIDARDANARTMLLLLLFWFPHDDPSCTILDMVNLLLKYGADVNARDNLLTTSLHLALHNGQLKIAQLLLKHEADVNAQDDDSQTPLHKLLGTKRQYKEEEASNLLRLFLEHGADVNKRDKHNVTPLGLALRSHRFKLAVILLEHGTDASAEIDDGMTLLHILSDCWINTRVAKVNARDEGNYTPLDLAIVRQDQLKIAGTLLEYGVDANAENYRGLTSLHILAGYKVDDEGDALNLARLLLEHGADVNRRDNNDETPLRRAIGWDPWQFNFACILVENGADPNTIESYEGMTLLHRLSEKGISDKYDVLHHTLLFLRHGADVNSKDKYSNTPLHLAIRREQFELAKLLLEHGADANAQNDDGSTPMHILSESEIKNKDDVFNLAYSLLKHGAEVNRQDKDKDTPLHLAIQWNQCNFARMLIERGADTNAEDNDGMTPLHILPGGEIQNEDDVLNIAHFLLEHGADANRRDGHNRTPLHLAMRWDQFKLAGFLVEHGADPTTEDHTGLTLLHRLSEKNISGKCDVLHHAFLFLKHGADVNRKDKYSNTPLHLAIRLDNFELAKFLLEHGADANAEDDIGSTPMHILLLEADIETKGDDLAHLLLEHGAEVNRRDSDNETPLHMAIRWHLYKLAGIFLEHGADPNAVNNDGKTPLRILSEGINYDDSEGDFVDHARLVLEHVTRMHRRDEDNKTSSILGLGRRTTISRELLLSLAQILPWRTQWVRPQPGSMYHTIPGNVVLVSHNNHLNVPVI